MRCHSKDAQNGVVWVSFYVNRDKVNFTTKISVKKNDWNEKKSLVGSGDKQASDKNLIIENIHSRINAVFVKYRLRDRVLTKDAFIRAYNRPDDYHTFYEFVDHYKKKSGNMNELSTMAVHETVIKKVKEFAPELHFDDITHDFLDRLYAHLRKTLKNNENTAYKNMTTFRKYTRAAWNAGYMDENVFKDWHIKRSKASYTFLTEEELTRLMKVYLGGTLELKYHKTLELFLFMCFSSLHIGDARSLKLEQFSSESFTYFRLKNRNSKPEPIMVPISDALRKILTNIVGVRRHGPVFEKLSADQTMNDYLKEICKMEDVKITKPISHKTGRHTFATIFLRKTKDLTSLKEILGHSELRETLIYAHVLDESKHEGVACFNGFV